MNQPAQDVVPENPGRWFSALDAPSARRRHEMKAPVRSLVRVMADVGPEHPLEVPTTVEGTDRLRGPGGNARSQRVATPGWSVCVRGRMGRVHVESGRARGAVGT